MLRLPRRLRLQLLRNCFSIFAFFFPDRETGESAAREELKINTRAREREKRRVFCLLAFVTGDKEGIAEMKNEMKNTPPFSLSLSSAPPSPLQLLSLRRSHGLPCLHRPQCRGEPVQPFIQPFAPCRHRPLHVPPPPSHLSQTERLAQSSGADRAR